MQQKKRLNLRDYDGRCVLLIVSALVLAIGAERAFADEPTKVTSRTGSDKAGATTETVNHPLVGFINEARRSLDSFAAVHDYQATFSKKELVGRTMFDDTMAIKFRQEPFSVYLRFVGRKNAGREVLYVAGKNQGKLLAHEGSGFASWAGTISIEPMSPRVMAEGRHPITEIGIRKMAEGIINLWEAELAVGYVEKDPSFYKTYPAARLDDLECRVLESTHSQPRQQFIFQTSRLFIDKKTNFPIRVEQWGFAPRPDGQPFLIEEYTYTGIRSNVGLKNLDFDTRNRAYHF